MQDTAWRYNYIWPGCDEIYANGKWSFNSSITEDKSLKMTSTTTSTIVESNANNKILTLAYDENVHREVSDFSHGSRMIPH
jgi:hypothetical protein